MDQDRDIARRGALDAGLLVEMTSDIVSSYVAHNHVPPADIPGMLSSVHSALSTLGRENETELAKAKSPRSPVSIKKSLTNDYIVSFEDGRRYKSLKRHLSKRDLTPDAYRDKWGLPRDYPMVAPSYSAARSALAKSMGLGSMRRRRASAGPTSSP